MNSFSFTIGEGFSPVLLKNIIHDFSDLSSVIFTRLIFYPLPQLVVVKRLLENGATRIMTQALVPSIFSVMVQS